MSQTAYWHRVIWRLATALILVVFLSLINPLPAAAQSGEDYFQLSYDPVSFSQNEIQGSEIFSATILGRATCTKDLPAPVSEASITARIIAEHTVSGTRVTLNSSYTITIKPFPSKRGDSAEINQVVPLQFPAQAETGNYNVIGEIIEAKVKVAFAWGEVTEYLPQSQLMGMVKYIAAELTAAPALPSTPSPPPVLAATSQLTPLLPPAPTPPEQTIVWWVWLIVAVASVTTAINIAWFLRHRTR